MFKIRYYQDDSNKIHEIEVGGSGMALLGEGEQTVFYTMDSRNGPIFSIPFNRLVSCVRISDKKKKKAEITPITKIVSVK